MAINIYLIMLILSIIFIFVLYTIGHEQKISIYLLLFCIVTLSFIGQYTVSTASSLETALVGHRIFYAGSVLTPTIMLLCVAKLCKINIPKPISISFILYGLVVLYFAYNVGNLTYYSSVDIDTCNNMTYLVKEHGPVHFIYPVFIIICMCGVIGIVIYSHVWKREVSRKISTLLLIFNVITVGLYFAEKIFDTTVALHMFGYVIFEFTIIILIRKIGMYDMSHSIAASIEEYSNYGYIIFDNDFRYMGSNSTAKTFLSEIHNLHVDKKINETDTPVIYTKLKRFFNNPEKDFSFSVEDDDRILKCNVQKLYYRERKHHIGYYIELIDTTQQHKYLELLNNYNSTLEEEVAQKTHRIEILHDKLILGMSDMIEGRDTSTGGHVKRTSLVIRIFADELMEHTNELGIGEQFLKNVVKAAPMHDLGKIAVDDRILRKSGKFTPEEFEEMKTHSEKGANIISKILDGVDDKDFYEIAVNIARYHHEKYNGYGYPSGLVGKSIPMEARIMALADVFDALVSKRCYKEKMNFDDAFAIIKDSIGNHFDPELGELFLKCRERLEKFYIEIDDSDKS